LDIPIRIDGTQASASIFVSSTKNELGLFISGISGEERNNRGWELLKTEHGVIENKAVFFYDEILSSSSLGPELDRDYFARQFDINDERSILEVSYKDEIDGMRLIADALDTYQLTRDQMVIIDITTMIVPYISSLLWYIIKKTELARLCFFYTEPRYYYKGKLPKTFSGRASSEKFAVGTDKIGNLEGYLGERKHPEDKMILVILLGFEGNRAFEIYQYSDPSYVIPINGLPAYRPEYKDYSLVFNTEIIGEKIAYGNIKYAPANDVFETKATLDQVYEQFSGYHDIEIAPIGTKPMALGCCLFALENNDCRIVYHYPRLYNPKTSVGFGKTWAFYAEISR
jgi:hypothetical protein